MICKYALELLGQRAPHLLMLCRRSVWRSHLSCAIAVSGLSPTPFDLSLEIVFELCNCEVDFVSLLLRGMLEVTLKGRHLLVR